MNTVENPVEGQIYCFTPPYSSKKAKVKYLGSHKTAQGITLFKLMHLPHGPVTKSDPAFLKEYDEKICGESTTKGGRKVMRKTKSKKHPSKKRRTHKRRTHKRRN